MRGDKIILFLEGNPNKAAVQYQRSIEIDRHRTFWAKTAFEAIDILENYRERLEIAYLGYNLVDSYYIHPSNENCGMEVVRWLEKQDSKNYLHVKFVVHDWSNFGRKMVNRLLDKGYYVTYAPFGLNK